MGSSSANPTTVPKRLHSVIDDQIARHRAGEHAADQKMYIIDACIAAGMDDRAIRGVCSYAVCGSYLYMGRVVALMLYHLLRDRALLDKVRYEVDGAFADRRIDPTLFRRMAHLRGTYFETLRRYPLVPAMPFFAARDTTIGGFSVSKGEMILITSLPSHFSEEHYNVPATFQAARCMRPRNEHLRRGAFAPFGGGVRTCVAVGMSEIVTLSVLSSVLLRRELRLVSPAYRVALAPNPLIGPSDGLPAICGEARRAEWRGKRDCLAESSDLIAAVEDERGFEALPAPAFQEVAAGELIFKQGSVADSFCIVVDGEVAIVEEKDGKTYRRGTLVAGRCHDEVATLKQAPRAASLRAETAVRVLIVSRERFMRLIRERDLLGSELGTVLQRRFMNTVVREALPSLDVGLLEQLLPVCAVSRRKKGDIIFRQGDRAERFYIVAAGSVALVRDDKIIGKLRSGEFFGELGLLRNAPRAATARAREDVELLQLSREDFELTMRECARTREDVSLTVFRRLMSYLETVEGGLSRAS